MLVRDSMIIVEKKAIVKEGTKSLRAVTPLSTA